MTVVLNDLGYYYAVYRATGGQRVAVLHSFLVPELQVLDGLLREGVDLDWFAPQLVLSILLIFDPALFLVDRTSSTMDCCLVSR